MNPAAPASATSVRPGKLRLKVASKKWRELATDEVTVGRARSSTVVVHDPRISRRHGRLVQDGTGWTYEDCGSRCGTWLPDGTKIDSLRIDGPTVLNLGEVEGVPLVVQPLDQLPRRPPNRRHSRPRPGEVVQTIGRDPGCDLVLEDLVVSRRHAEVLRMPDGTFMVRDCGSVNGTWIGGTRTEGLTPLAEGSVVAIGTARLLFSQGRLVPVDVEAMSLSGVSAWAGEHRLLDDVSLRVGLGEFVAVVGPSGAGKSTLLSVMTGARAVTSGSAEVDGRDLAQHRDELGPVLGHVPQDDLVHAQLTARQVLSYAARLRFPADVPAADRERRCEEVLTELGLDSVADLPVSRLSGGQRKRVNVGVELLTGPRLLLLDEPTSGLDPGHDKSLMTMFRRLADAGRAVVLVTHNVGCLEMCDRVVWLATGGSVAFDGSAVAALEHFGCQDYADIFPLLTERPPAPKVAPPTQRGRPTPRSRRPKLDRHQLAVLIRRYLAILRADRRNLAILLLQAPLLGLFTRALFDPAGLAATQGSNPHARRVLLMLVISITWLGAANAVREIVKERRVIQRERAFGVSGFAQLLSKTIVLAVLTAVQAALLVVVATTGQRLPARGVLMPAAPELFIGLFAAGMAALAVGLLISSSVNNADKAMSLLPLLLVPQLVLSGGLLDLGGNPILRSVSVLASARWGFAANAATVDLPRVEDSPGSPATAADGVWRHTSGTWALDIAAMAAMAVAGLLIAERRLRR